MTEILSFAGDHPVLTFCLAYIVGEVIVRSIVRVTRSINVAIRGWPPAHLDADGDWKPEPEKGE